MEGGKEIKVSNAPSKVTTVWIPSENVTEHAAQRRRVLRRGFDNSLDYGGHRMHPACKRQRTVTNMLPQGQAALPELRDSGRLRRKPAAFVCANRDVDAVVGKLPDRIPVSLF